MLLVVTLILAQAELNVKRLLARMVARHKGIGLKPVTLMWINSGGNVVEKRASGSSVLQLRYGLY